MFTIISRIIVKTKIFEEKYSTALDLLDAFKESIGNISQSLKGRCIDYDKSSYI